MDYDVYTEEELETIAVIKTYNSVNKTKIVGEVVPINHRPSAERMLMQTVKEQEAEADPYFLDDSSFDFNCGSFYNEVVGKHKIYDTV